MGTSAPVLIVLGSVLVGGIIGSLLRIEDRLEGLGAAIRRRHPARAGRRADRERFVEGFVTASLVFCVGPLTILGSLDDGLGRGIDKLALKATLDGFASIAFAASLGWGVAASALVVARGPGLADPARRSLWATCCPSRTWRRSPRPAGCCSSASGCGCCGSRPVPVARPAARPGGRAAAGGGRALRRSLIDPAASCPSRPARGTMLPATGEPTARPRPGGALVRTRVAFFLATLLSALVVVLGMGAGPAQAEGESIFGFLFQTKAANGSPTRASRSRPTGPGGLQRRGDQRRDRPLDHRGARRRHLHRSTSTRRPCRRASTSPTSPSRPSRSPVLVDQDKPVIFPLGKSTRQVASKWTQAAQLTAEGLRFGLIIALASVGLSLIFGTTGLTNFAHGELVTHRRACSPGG